MGYRSDIVIAFAFETKEQVDEVLAIYRMNQHVQKHDLAKEWQVREWGDCWGLTYQADSVKWYDSYEDVQGFEHMLNVVETFANERIDVAMETDPDGKQALVQMFPYASHKLRIGENDDDIEWYATSNDSNLEEVLYERMNLRREIETDF
jgi:hypothetical protein